MTPQQLLAELLRQLQGAVASCTDSLDVASVHAMRVAARRLRALLRCLRDEAHPMSYLQLRFDLTNLGRALGEVRAADIRLQQIAALLRQCTSTPRTDRSALRSLATHAAKQARATLQQRMQQPGWRQRLQRLTKMLGQDELLLLPTGAATDVYGALLLASLRKTSRALRATRHSAHALHRQRIRIKNARYVCELLMHHVAVDLRPAVTALDKAQDLLGELHDLQALRTWLGSAARGPLNQALIELATTRARRCRKRFHRFQAQLRQRLRDAASAL